MIWNSRGTEGFRREGGVIHTDGLTEEETEAVRRLVELLRRKGRA